MVSGRNITRLCLVVFLVLGARAILASGTAQQAETDTEPDGSAQAEGMAVGGFDNGNHDPRSPISPNILEAAEVCPSAGYLCSDPDSEWPLRILRWPEDTRVIQVWVPPPPDIAPQAALELQRAAARGLEAWDGHPFPLAVRTRAVGPPAHVTVEWKSELGGGRLGRAQIKWVVRGTEIQVHVVGLSLATRYPGNPGREVDAHSLELVAAHEMGHVLGLPHSDDPWDVMYPMNTARHLSARDYRTLEALYSLPIGAEIR